MTTIAIDDQLLLRSYEPDDARQLFDAVNTSRRHLDAWLVWVGKTTRPEHSLQFIQDAAHKLHTQEALSLGIFYEGNIVGGLGMHDWHQDTRRAQIGYWIAREHEGKGIVHRSLAPFITYLFERIGLNKLEAHYVPGNVRSARVAERLGFKIEGIIRQSHMLHGHAEDMVMTGLLKSEWQPTTL